MSGWRFTTSMISSKITESQSLNSDTMIRTILSPPSFLPLRHLSWNKLPQITVSASPLPLHGFLQTHGKCLPVHTRYPTIFAMILHLSNGNIPFFSSFFRRHISVHAYASMNTQKMLIFSILPSFWRIFNASRRIFRLIPVDLRRCSVTSLYIFTFVGTRSVNIAPI